MKIIVDAFGGDNAPLEIIKGCAEAVAEFDDLSIILTGDEGKILKVANDNNISLDRIEIHHCTEVITMDDHADAVLKSKKDSSMAVGFNLLKNGEGDAFVSAGNSGALCMGATLAVKRIKGIKRPAFSPVMPSANGFFMLVDGGANVDCRPEMLVQFAVMGSIYMNRVMKIDNPRVGLANVGTEDHKGTELYQTTYQLLKESNLNYVGNVVLKTYEGVAMVVMNEIKSLFTGSLKGKLSASLVLGDIKTLKKKLDHNTYGGAPVLGASKPVFKAHGSAKAVTVKNAIRLSRDYVLADAIGEISKVINSED